MTMNALKHRSLSAWWMFTYPACAQSIIYSVQLILTGLRGAASHAAGPHAEPVADPMPRPGPVIHVQVVRAGFALYVVKGVTGLWMVRWQPAVLMFYIYAIHAIFAIYQSHTINTWYVPDPGATM